MTDTPEGNDQTQPETSPLVALSELFQREVNDDEADELFKRAEDIATWSFWPLESTRRPDF